MARASIEQSSRSSSRSPGDQGQGSSKKTWLIVLSVVALAAAGYLLYSNLAGPSTGMGPIDAGQPRDPNAPPNPAAGQPARGSAK